MIAAAIVKLASHYHRPDFGPEQAKHMALDFIEDLGDCTMAEIENAVRDYRRDSKKRFFPTPGNLLDLIAAGRKHRREVEALKPAKSQFPTSRPLMWWHRPRDRWNREWQESEVPMGEQIKDTAGGPLRDPERVVF